MEPDNSIIRLSPPAGVSMDDDWYEFTDRQHFWMQWRLMIMRRTLTDNVTPTEPALDIGTGAGVARLQIEESFNMTVDGCDLNEEALGHATPGRGRLMIYDIFERQPGMLGYKSIFLLDVVEHLDDDRAFLRAATDHLAESGLVVINVPAFQAFYSRYDKTVGHKRRYNRQQLTRLMNDCGIEIVKTTYWGFMLLPVLVARNLVMKFTPPEKQIKRGMSPPGRLADLILRVLMKAEEGLIALTGGFPVGTSLFAVGRLRRR